MPLEDCISREVNIANQSRWYDNNSMIVNETKHQGMVLEKIERKFSLPLIFFDILDIFGMNIDHKL